MSKVVHVYSFTNYLCTCLHILLFLCLVTRISTCLLTYVLIHVYVFLRSLTEHIHDIFISTPQKPRSMKWWKTCLLSLEWLDDDNYIRWFFSDQPRALHSPSHFSYYTLSYYIICCDRLYHLQFFYLILSYLYLILCCPSSLSSSHPLYAPLQVSIRLSSTLISSLLTHPCLSISTHISHYRKISLTSHIKLLPSNVFHQMSSIDSAWRSWVSDWACRGTQASTRN